MTRNGSLASSRSGQALIEYVLILFVSISLIMGVRTLMVGMKNFMEGYMGSYVRCLMDYGELPTRGIQVDDLKKSTSGSYICNQQFSFSVQNGFQSNGNGGSFGDGSGGGSASKTGPKSITDSSNAKSVKDSESSNSTGTTSGSSLSDVASRERNRRSRESSADNQTSENASTGLLKSGRVRSSDGEDDVSNSSSRVIGNAQKGESADVDGDSARSGRARYRALTGVMAEKIEKNSKRAQTNSKSKPGVPVVIAEEEGGTLGPRKSTMTPWERKPTAVEVEEESAFSVGKFFKYIIIIAMIIMIVIFFGGQLLNYSKSDE